jgi:dTDP-4-amino-4,6-dideoxygalactose transaminase
MINVTKTFLPPIKSYLEYIEKLWLTGWITNNGVLVQELEARLAGYLDVPVVKYMSNGTVALQVALKTLNITGDVITTPFSYVATTTSILWEGCNPIFVDIENKTFCIDADKIEDAITQDTQAILAVHVYGYPCDISKINNIAKKYGLYVIYDAAHAFGVKINGVSLLNFGDISTLSFHATKVFHTVEGGAIITQSKKLAEDVSLRMSFGHKNDDYYTIGINCKNSELHAAMGLAVLPYLDSLIASRRRISELYDNELTNLNLQFPEKTNGLDYNYSYYPVVFKSESDLLRVKTSLAAQGVNTRRYFYPSLNRLPYHIGSDCPVAEDISSRILCLPLYPGLNDMQAIFISEIIRNELA